MKACSHRLRPVLLAVASAAACLVSSCVWDPWIPGQSKWNPDIVVDPATLPQPLALDAPYVDELDCYARRCQKRFRVIVDRPGELTVYATMDLAGQDEQARIVLESTRGVIAREGTGRGVRTDVSPLTVTSAVEPGTYSVLIQSVGGRIPYELTATLTPGVGPTASPRVEPATPPEPRRPEGPPPRITKVDLGSNVGGGYDPAVIFSSIRTFTFARPFRPGAPLPADASLETPGDRQIRRFLAEGLELKGFRQATGSDEADLLVTFSTSQKSRALYAMPVLYARYDFTDVGTGFEVDTRGTLVVDFIDTRSDRIAWHAWTTKGMGPGVTYGEKTRALVREAVTEVLAAFPPH